MTTLAALDEVEQRSRYWHETPDANKSLADQARNAWWAMVTVMDDLARELARDFVARAFDENSRAGMEEDRRYDDLTNALRELGKLHDGMEPAIERVIQTRQSLIDWRNHDPNEDNRF